MKTYQCRGNAANLREAIDFAFIQANSSREAAVAYSKMDSQNEVIEVEIAAWIGNQWGKWEYQRVVKG